jgi:ArsR family metal-binding transcriptional regulator
LFEEYSLRVSRPGCSPTSTKLSATVELEDDIAELLPYINGLVDKALFYPDIPYLRFTRDGRTFILYPNEIGFGGLKDRAEGEEVLHSMFEFLRNTADHLDELEPCYDTPKLVKPLDVFRLLPGSNCGECGEATCMAFAAKASRGKLEPEACTALDKPQYSENRRKLFDLLA